MCNVAATSLLFKTAYIADFTQVLVGVTKLKEGEHLCSRVSCVLGEVTVLLVNCVVSTLRKAQNVRPLGVGGH